MNYQKCHLSSVFWSLDRRWALKTTTLCGPGSICMSPILLHHKLLCTCDKNKPVCMCNQCYLAQASPALNQQGLKWMLNLMETSHNESHWWRCAPPPPVRTGAPSSQNQQPEVKVFNPSPFIRLQHHADPLQISEQPLSSDPGSSPDGVCHAVGPQGPHHAQPLKQSFVLPLLREYLLFRALRLHQLLPALGRALDVSVQVLELFHWAQGLVGRRRRRRGGGGVKKKRKRTVFFLKKSAAATWPVMRVKVFDHSGDISRCTAKSGNLSLQKRRLRLKKKGQRIERSAYRSSRLYK